jgi:hypothetical protein
MRDAEQNKLLRMPETSCDRLAVSVTVNAGLAKE